MPTLLAWMSAALRRVALVLPILSPNLSLNMKLKVSSTTPALSSQASSPWAVSVVSWWRM